MKILETNKEFELAVFKALSSSPKFLYIATYGINIQNEFSKKLFKNAPKNTTIIIGSRDYDHSIWHKNITAWLHAYKLKAPIFRSNFHTKMIVTDKYAIVGGRNLTGSEWEDRSFLLTAPSSVKACKASFEKMIKK